MYDKGTTTSADVLNSIYALLRYASQYWTTHFDKAREILDHSLLTLVNKFVHSPALLNWLSTSSVYDSLNILGFPSFAFLSILRAIKVMK
jgi:hypothetical protein